MITLLVILAFVDVCSREFSVLFGSFTSGCITINARVDLTLPNVFKGMSAEMFSLLECRLPCLFTV